MPMPPGSETPGRLAVICGNGRLPGEVIAAAAAAGRDPLAIAIRGEAEPSIEALAPTLWFDWGQIGKMLAALGERGVCDVVLIGGISRRPDFLSILGDFGTMRRLPKIVKALKLGDDGLLKGVIALFEESGIRVIGAHEIAPSMLAGRGQVGHIAVPEEGQRDLDIAGEAARALGRLDIGQAAVAVNGRVIATEAAEGTDAMLQRCLDLKAAGRVRWKGKAGVLAKCVKPGQDLRVDLPSIGPVTLDWARRLGLAGIAVDAGHVLIANRDETIRQADAAGVFLVGLDARREPDAPPDEGRVA